MKRSLFTIFALLTAILCYGGSHHCKTYQIEVTTTVGQAPTLPEGIFIKDTWRQVRWENTDTTTEWEEARMAVGEKYDVQGLLLGTGEAVTAHVTVKGLSPTLPRIVARPLPLYDVKLTGENTLTRNRDRDIDNLLSLDISQQLYNYHDTYGMPLDGMTTPDGWDSPTTKLKGHGVGHFMSALALAYASVHGTEKGSQIRQRIETIVNTLRKCQERTFCWDSTKNRYFEARDYSPENELIQMKGTWKDFDEYKKDYRHYGYGYLNAIPAAHPALIECYRPYNNEEWVWAPYYTIHKQLAGLADIASVMMETAQNEEDKRLGEKALTIARDMGLWVWNRLHYRTYLKTDGTQKEKRQKPGNRYEMWNMYIAGEVGGMQEILARLARMTHGEDSTRLLEAAQYFDAPAFYDPLSHNVDDIRTRHANQHIPMITGALNVYSETGDIHYYNIASNFWNLVQGRYTYSTGGVGNGEMFRQPYSQMISMLPNPNINETCCAYNLAKLSRDLAQFDPNDARYMDYYERLLYNQIVGSLSPDRWAVCYQYAVGENAEKPFGNETPQSTCCGGTGVENHVRYQEVAYYTGGDTLWVNLYLPSEAQWREKAVTIRQEGEWQGERMTTSILPTKGSITRPMTVRFRVPYWATADFCIRLNGKKIAKKFTPCSYAEIPQREWSANDRIDIEMPYGEHLWYGPDPVEGQWMATTMHGPLAMVTTEDGTIAPDYAYTGKATHYHPAGRYTSASGAVDSISRRELVSAITTARQRWENSSDWAPHALRRMVTQLRKDEDILTNSSATQQEIDDATSALSRILNEMRPSTLAEPEDLTHLKQLMEQNRNTASKEVLDYAEMVVHYVEDGSGTKDLIKKAVSKFNSRNLNK